MNKAAVKFVTQVDPGILTAVNDLAKKEGRKIQALVDEAFLGLPRKRKNTNAKPHVMAAYR